MPQKGIALIDGPHITSVAKALGYTVDFKELLRLLRVFKGYQLVRAYYFTPVLADAEHDSVRPLVDWLTYNGFAVVERPVREDSSRRREPSVEMSVVALEVGPTVDSVVLFAGNEDLVPVVEALKRKGVVVTVVSTIALKPAAIHDSLRRVADDFIDLDDIRQSIERRK